MAPTLYSHWINFSVLCSHEATWKLRCKHFVNNNATKMKKRNPLWFVHNDFCVANTAFVYTDSILWCHLFNPWKDVQYYQFQEVLYGVQILPPHTAFSQGSANLFVLKIQQEPNSPFEHFSWSLKNGREDDICFRVVAFWQISIKKYESNYDWIALNRKRIEFKTCCQHHKGSREQPSHITPAFYWWMDMEKSRNILRFFPALAKHSMLLSKMQKFEMNIFHKTSPWLLKISILVIWSTFECPLSSRFCFCKALNSASLNRFLLPTGDFPI